MTPLISTNTQTFMRAVGRIAAPLFLYMVTQGLRHTRSKEKYAIRLYIASFLMAIGNFAFLFVRSAVSPPSDNIFATFFYVALYVLLSEKFITFIKSKNRAKACLTLAAMLIPLSFTFVNRVPFILHRLYPGIPAMTLSIMRLAARALFSDPISVSYSFIFIMLGVAWYYIKSKPAQCGLFAAVCLVSFLCNWTPQEIPQFLFNYEIQQLFVHNQYFMFLAIPFIWLYNGVKGRSLKYFFYVYYPLNCYIFFLIGNAIINY
jgi:hypothetical protein